MNNNGKIAGVLVSFGYSVISGSKRDPTITAEVLEERSSSNDAGSWSNRLFPASTCGRVNSYTSLRKHCSQMRAWHYNSTYVMEDAIWRILPDKRVAAYKQMVELDGKARAYELMEAFATDLPNLIDMARLARGEAFKEADYPTAEDVRTTFKYSVSYRPIPTAAGLNPAWFEEAIAEINALHAKRLQEANAALIERFMAPFKTLQDQLANPEGRKIAPVIESICEITAMVPTLDLSGNTELVTAAQQMNQLFQALKPEMIKQDEEVRRMLTTTCGNVLERLSTFGAVGSRKFT